MGPSGHVPRRPELSGTHWAAIVQSTGTLVTAGALLLAWRAYAGEAKARRHSEKVEDDRRLTKARLVRSDGPYFAGELAYQPVTTVSMTVRNLTGEPVIDTTCSVHGEESDAPEIIEPGSTIKVTMTLTDSIPWPEGQAFAAPPATIRYTFPDATRWERTDNQEPVEVEPRQPRHRRLT